VSVTPLHFDRVFREFSEGRPAAEDDRRAGAVSPFDESLEEVGEGRRIGVVDRP
jgi:hypothetical protein